jgi:hypothetical protein
METEGRVEAGTQDNFVQHGNGSTESMLIAV